MEMVVQGTKPSLVRLLNSPPLSLEESAELSTEEADDLLFVQKPGTPPACFTRRRTPFSILKSSSVGSMGCLAERSGK
ncbi:unnamed protein product [Dibothriocephalus latus]|uniref:Uncharacterized protein n=1 Tax=Dibothriocephalus latus TaxID=60516 RepID=A0A3P7QRR8_DIBLA|nr:unnamed protein product [Dibothriocephalus latus]